MTTPKLFRVFGLLVCMCVCGTLEMQGAEPAPKKDAQSVLNEMRLRRWTKDLELSAEQQKKVQAVLDEERTHISKLDGDTALTPTARRSKVDEIHDATYAKIKPVLNPTQLAAFEKSIAKSKPKKKTVPASP